jgi:peptidoglycan/LPS O-acetylase OafA/YrhL
MAEMKHLKYRPDIDGLRSIAVLAVVAFHAFPRHFAGGYVGVDIFFIISGFLISGILFDNLDQNSFSIAEFYSRRVRRIFPALSVVLITCLGFGWVSLLADEFQALGKQTAAGVGFVSNFLFWSESGYFDVASETKPLLHLWSLAIEEQFYIFWPLLLYAADRWRLRFMNWVLVLVVASVLYGAYMVHKDATGAFYSPGSRVWELAFGGILAYIHRRPIWMQWRDRSRLRRYLSPVAMILIVLLIRKEERFFPGAWSVLSTTAAVMLIFSGSESWLNKKFLSHPWMIWVGLISYPFYLWHWPFLSFARIMESGTPSVSIRVAAVLLSFLAAILTFYGVEKPLRQGVRKTVIVPVLCMIMAAIGLFGYLVFAKPGWYQNSLASNPFRDSHLLPEAGVCLPEYEPYGKLDRCFSNDPKPSTVLIGDSHAGHYYWGFLKTNQPISVMWNGGCPPMETIEFDQHQCPERWQAMKKYLADRRGQIKVVLISMYYRMYLAETEPSGKPSVTYQKIQEEWKKNNTSEAPVAKLVQEGLERTISYLEEQGFQVGVLSDVPLFPYEPPTCVTDYRPMTLSKKATTCQPLAIEKLHEQQSQMQNILAAVQSKHPAVRFFDPIPYLCNDQNCPMVVDGKLMFRDADHLSDTGSVLMARQLETWMKASFSR